jgi:hypothetical protein
MFNGREKYSRVLSPQTYVRSISTSEDGHRTQCSYVLRRYAMTSHRCCYRSNIEFYEMGIRQSQILSRLWWTFPIARVKIESYIYPRTKVLSQEGDWDHEVKPHAFSALVLDVGEWGRELLDVQFGSPRIYEHLEAVTKKHIPIPSRNLTPY